VAWAFAMAAVSIAARSPQSSPQSVSQSKSTGGKKAEAALAQEVHVFRDLCRQHDHQFAELHAQACDLESQADKVDMELVYALDRAEFARTQLHMGPSMQGGKAAPQNLADFLSVAGNADNRLKHHLQTEDELQNRRERVARVIAHMRILQSLCQISQSLPGSHVEQNLTELLRQCEAKLIASSEGDAELEYLATGFCRISPLHLMLPLLSNRQPADDTPSGTQDQWLLPARSLQRSTTEEDSRLQHEIEQLADRNEVLRRELAAQVNQQGASEIEARGASDAEAEAARESEMWRRSAQILTEEVA
jgi:hypothetical protein